jgi:hypothetical protein
MNLLKEYELEKRKTVKCSNYKKGGDMYFFCGICHNKCYQDTSSGLVFYKKVLLNHNRSTNSKYSKYFLYDKNNKMWMKVCFKCKYKNKLLGYCIKCDQYYLRNTETLKNRCSL